MLPERQNSKEERSPMEAASIEGRSPEQPNCEEVRSPDQSTPRKRKRFPKFVTDRLKEWIVANKHHPYPEENVKTAMALELNLTLTQINNWFINCRRRFLSKQFPMNDQDPDFKPKRGARKSIKRRVDGENDAGPSSEKSIPRKKGRRADVPTLHPQEVTAVESYDANSSPDKIDIKPDDMKPMDIFFSPGKTDTKPDVEKPMNIFSPDEIDTKPDEKKPVDIFDLRLFAYVACVKRLLDNE